ncbi:VOC family protein [Pedobacter sp. Leaf194]|uniref:VOC family protein n=1 Tax=Pedobacter sp. Leaf194 TaxID=1736297 RepID=UPI0007034A62|nr:VOC family protein [Pedobacter sp. Leaf194]KQS40935.1 glyoxalase [Pedobacter sp. Leaf194]
MIKMHPYLNFYGQAEEAFNFYKSTFGGEFIALMRMGDMPDADKLPQDEQHLIMHIALPINENLVLMASDCIPSAKHVLTKGNSMYISVSPDSREEAERLFNGLSAGGDIEMPLEDQFWGDYFGSFKDKYGICWMINFGAYQ